MPRRPGKPVKRAAPAAPASPFTPAPLGQATWLIAVALIAVTSFVYAPVRGFDFVELDDPAYVSENAQVRGGLTAGGAAWALTTGHAANWHPLTWMSLMADVSLFGVNPGAHHVVNLVLHVASAVLLLLVLARLTGSPWRSGFVAAVFALHPLHVESVAWIAERKDVLSALFWMLTIAAYVSYVAAPGPRRRWTVAVVFALGLMAKPMLVTLPVVLLLLDLWPLRRWSWSRKVTVWPLVREKLPLFALAMASSVITVIVQQRGGAVASLESMTLGRRLATAVAGAATYIQQTVWPAGLSVIYPLPDQIPAATIAWSVFLIGALTLLAWRAGSSRPALTTGWFWYLAVLLPVSGLIQIGVHLVADRYTYLPMIGLSIAAAWAIPDSMLRNTIARAGVALAAVALVIGMTLATRQHLPVWRDNIALFTNASMRTLGVDEYTAHLQLGSRLYSERRFPEARKHFELAAAIQSGSLEAKRGIGLTLIGAGQPAAAIPVLEEATRLSPNDVDARNDLAVAYVQTNRIDDAIREYRQLAALRPGERRYQAALAELLKRVK